MLSQLLHQWQQSLSPQASPITPIKENTTSTFVQDTPPTTAKSDTTPQTSPTPSRLMIPPDIQPHQQHQHPHPPI